MRHLVLYGIEWLGPHLASVDRILRTSIEHHFSIFAVERSYAQAVPELRPVFLIVQNVHSYGRFGLERLTDCLNGFWVGLWSLQEAAISTQRFLCRIPCLYLEFIADEDHRIVRLGRIGDYNALLALLFTQECSFSDITVTFRHSSGLTCSGSAPFLLRNYKHMNTIKKVQIGARPPEFFDLMASREKQFDE